MFHGGNVETSHCGALKFLGKTFAEVNYLVNFAASDDIRNYGEAGN